MSFEIRRADAGDRSLLVAFHHALYDVHRKQMVPENEAELGEYKNLPEVLRQDAQAILSRPQSIAFVAFHDEEAAGYITGRVEEDPRRVLPRRGIVEDWYVDEPFRGNGLGRRLLDTLLQHFRDQHCDVAESTTWPRNQAARRAHASAGFLEVETKFRRRL